MAKVDPQSAREKALSSFRRGARQEALAEFELALAGFKKRDDELGQAEVLNDMGVLYRLNGQTQAAIDALRQSETIFSQLGEHNRRGQSLGNLGDAYAGNRQRDEAARCYSDAAALFASDGDREKQSQVLRAFSLLRLRQGRWLEALMRMEESLSVRPRLGLGALLFRGMLRFALRLLTGG
jgi:tetratricopeptide (TPR) repeat protein